MAETTLKTLGDFEIISKVGEGGMGAVFRARQRRMDRFVALKILAPRLAQNQSFKERFFQEARMSAKLNHLNIIGGIDCGEVDGHAYFAMEFVDGRTLKQILKERGKFPYEQAARIVRQITEALIYAQAQNMIHRDIKPDNIMLTTQNVAKLCDLGLAKQTENPEDAHLTQEGLAVGTPHFIAPEQARGSKDIDCRCDIYSLGATFYYLVTGRTPFFGETGAVIMAQHLADTAPSPCDLDTNIPEGYGLVISKMMGKTPAERYNNARELAADLDAILEDKTPTAVRFRGKSSCAMPAHCRTTGPRSAVGRISGTRPAVGKTTGPVGRISGHRPAVSGTTGPAARISGPRPAVSGTTGPRAAVGTSGPRPAVDKAAVRTIPVPQRAQKGLLPMAIGGVIVLGLTAVIWLLVKGASEDGTRKEADPKPPVVLTASGDITKGNTATKTVLSPDPAKEKDVPKVTPAAVPTKDDDLLSQADLVGTYLRQKNYPRAAERLAALEHDVPKDAFTYPDWRKKLDDWNAAIHEGSKDLADQLLKEADAKAQAGDSTGVTQALNPPRLQNLLNEDAERARAAGAQLQELAQQKVKEKKEQEQAKLVAAVKDAEKKLPAKGSLPAAPAKAAVCFGPEKTHASIKWTGGANSLHKPDGKLAYVDGLQKLAFTGDDTAMGNLGTSVLVLEYNATKELDIDVRVKGTQFNWLGGTIKAPAGELKTFEIPITRQNLWKRGGKDGRPINEMTLEFKNVQPGTLQVFRLYRK